MAEPASPVLDLITAQERPTVKIDGRAYEIRTANDLTLSEYSLLRRQGPRIGALMLKDDRSELEDQELTESLDRLCRRVVLAPDDVHARLGDINRTLIFGVFTELLTPSLLAARANREASSSRGTISSPASPDSTAGTPSAGARPRRSGRSART